MRYFIVLSPNRASQLTLIPKRKRTTTTTTTTTTDDDDDDDDDYSKEQKPTSTAPTVTGMGTDLKRSIFMTAKSPEKAHQQMHLVRGREMPGLIVDPGAAAGVMGTETLRDFVKGYLHTSGRHYELAPPTSTFTGIDGRP